MINLIVRAQEAIDPDPITSPTGYSGEGGLGNLLTNVATTVVMAAGILLFGMLIFGGITWLTAQGNEDQVEKAQRIISNAVIGLVIVIAAFFITQILGSALGFGNILNISVPQP